MIKSILLLGCLMGGIMNSFAADTLKVCSPSGDICVQVWKDKQLQYSVYHKNKLLIRPSVIDFILEKNGRLSDAGIRRSVITKVNERIDVPVPEKRKEIIDRYHQLHISFNKPLSVSFRAYDDGVAYRIETRFKDSIVVRDEVAEIRLPEESGAYYPKLPAAGQYSDRFHTSFEEHYPFLKVSEISDTGLAYVPVLVTAETFPSIGIVESDLEEYPGMFLRGTGTNALSADFPGYPLVEERKDELYSQEIVKVRANYIARTKGTRTFPWRVFIIAEEDRELPASDMVYRLASPSKVQDVSWIQPGNLTDEWITDINLYDVPFKAGINTASYKYYIDFAHRFGFERIMMDAGWSDINDLFKIVPEIDMDTLAAYAASKGVKIAMWTLALTLEQQLDSALDQFKKWGVDFIMTDFINRDDQKAVQFHHKIAAACADKKIMIMYHGSFPPKGFNRTWPNAVAREGVLGSEYNIWHDGITPGHDVLLAYTRMLAGNLDYEPGLLNNVSKDRFRSIPGYVMSPGTRCHQMAMFLVYDSPMQIFSGNISQGMKEPELMGLIGSLPTVWTDTRVLQGKIGEYIVTARQQGDDWYIGGMSDWSARDLELSLDFLGEGNYEATLCLDGINANRYAGDYRIERQEVSSNQKLNLSMAQGGGFLIRLIKK